MPIVDCGWKDRKEGTGSQLLETFGPIFWVVIGFDAEYFSETDKPKPNSLGERVPALIDTGATESFIDTELAEKIGLPAVDKRQLAGASGLMVSYRYMGQVHIPDLNVNIMGPFNGVTLSEGEQRYRVLIGRTFLRNTILHYDGRTGAVSIAL